MIGTASRSAGRLSERIGPRWPLTIEPIITGVGFALMATVDPGARYWSSVLPALAVIALGMVGAVAPLTTAVLSSVDDHHTGTASGFNSAIARTGGLIATALAGAVVAASVVQLTRAFHAAGLLAAFSEVTAGIIAFVTLGQEHGRR